MDQALIDELKEAILGKRIINIDQGQHPGAHSEPFTYKAANGDDYVLLRAKNKDFVGGYVKQQTLYPFLQSQNLPVKTARELTIIECGDDSFAVME